MKLLTKYLRQKLEENHREMVSCRDEGREEPDQVPVVKFFTPWGRGTWLLTELCPDGRMFGLCDLGMGFPELGFVGLWEIEEIRGPAGMKIERDRHWKPRGTLSDYATAANEAMRLVELPHPAGEARS